MFCCYCKQGRPPIRFSIRPSKKPSLSANLSRTLPLPGEIPSDVDPPIFVGRSWYPIIKDLSLHTWTSAAESTNQHFPRGPSIAKIFGCQLSISGAPRVLFCSASAGVAAFLKFWFDPLVLMWRREYLARSSGCVTQHQSVK